MSRIVAICEGGDWADASVAHLVVPEGLDLQAAKTRYNIWLRDEYGASFGPDPSNPSRRTQLLPVPFWTFPEFLIHREGAEDAQLEEFWEGP